MRILHVVPTYLPATRYGGPIYSVHGLCKAQAQLGHDVEVCTTSVDGPGDSDVPHERSVDMEGVGVRYFRSARLRRLYYAPAMQRYLRERLQSFDALHLHSVFLWPTSMAARLAVERRVPYVVAPRGMLVPELIRRKNYLIKSAWLQTVERRTLRDAAAVHMTTDLERRDALRVGLPLPRPIVIPNGVEIPPDPLIPLPSCPLASFIDAQPFGLYLGRLVWKKGLDRLLHAMTSGTTRMAICGPDDENYMPVLRSLQRELRLPDERLFLGGPVLGAAKWTLLSRARFLVLPSLHENFGNVVAEAMAVGCPVIVTPEVGAQELVAEADCGIVAPGDAATFGAAMERLWRDPGLCAALGARGRDYALSQLTWSHVAERTARMYRELIAAAR
jgi:glycosyltransferase involved in cell wall biosynthesis